MKNSIKKAILIILIAMLSQCIINPGEPLLSQLFSNNRITVIMKATYASDNPLDFTEINGNQLFIDPDDNPDLGNLPSYSTLPIFIDIGEIRMSTKNFMSDLLEIQSTRDAEKFWDVVSTERQIFVKCSNLILQNINIESCFKPGPISNFEDLMNGKGAVFPAMDVGAGWYLHTGIYMRSIVTGYSKLEGVETETKFDNDTVFNAANILPVISYDPDADTQQQYLPPQIFPLHHKVVWGQQSQMHVEDDTFFPMVLEIRFNLKENLMIHSYTNSSSQKRTIIAISDWRRAHDEQVAMGGNLLMRSRLYYPDFTRNIRIDGGTENAPIRHYYALYILNECTDLSGNSGCDLQDQLPVAATPVRAGNGNTLSNIPAGSYRLQCREDIISDGFPEEVLSEQVVDFGPGPAPVVEIYMACG